jgi:hypothetical protein
MVRNGSVVRTINVPLGMEMLVRVYGLRNWWLNPLVRFPWSVICSMVSGAVPAPTLACVIIPSFNTSAFIRARGSRRGLGVGLTITTPFPQSVLARTKTVEYRLCTERWIGRLGPLAGSGTVITLAFMCWPLVRSVRCRATVGLPLAVDLIADDGARVALTLQADGI